MTRAQRRIGALRDGPREVVPAGGAQRRAGAAATVAHTDVHADRRIAALAATQAGVVTREHLLALGLGRGAIGRRLERGTLVVHERQTLSTADTRILDGLPITSPARTLVDLAATMPLEALDIALAEAQVLRLVTPAAVRAALARAPRQPGTAALRGLLDGGHGAPTRSELERTMLRLLARAGLPRPRVNTRIARYEVDFAWPAHRLVVETDGWSAHGHRRAFERDRARDVDLQAGGWTVVRMTWRQLTAEPLRAAARLAQLLALRER